MKSKINPGLMPLILHQFNINPITMHLTELRINEILLLAQCKQTLKLHVYH